jgi:acyl-CoA thioesterase-1
LVQHFVQIALFAWAIAAAGGAFAQDRPVKIVAFGDSLTAGFQLPASQAFPARLERALKAKGLPVAVANAGVSGDTASGGAARVGWSVPADTDAVILELGANDMLRGVDPKITRSALDSIIRTLKSRGIEVLLAGMRAPPNLGPEYRRAYDSIFPDLASAHGLIFYPFFIDGIATDPRYNLHDGLHPNQEGVDVIVARILPKVEELIARVRARR